MEPVAAPMPTGFRGLREAGRTEEGRMMKKKKMNRRRRRKKKYRSMKTCSQEKIWRSSMRNSTHWCWRTEEGAGGGSQDGLSNKGMD